MQYIGRHREPRPLFMRRPVLGGVTAAVLVGLPLALAANGFLMQVDPVSKPLPDQTFGSWPSTGTDTPTSNLPPSTTITLDPEGNLAANAGDNDVAPMTSDGRPRPARPTSTTTRAPRPTTTRTPAPPPTTQSPTPTPTQTQTVTPTPTATETTTEPVTPTLPPIPIPIP